MCKVLSKDEIKPLEHQRFLCNWFKKNNPYKKGLLIYHSLGSGKTYTSIFLLKCLLRTNQQALVLTPKSLQSNYKQQLDKVSGINTNNVTIETYGKAISKMQKGELSCANKILIIDEAHNLRNSYSTRTKSILNCAAKASKVILLTATPIYNQVDDIVNMMQMITNLSPSKIKQKLHGLPFQFNELFNCNVSIYKNPANSKDFPTSSFIEKKLTMPLPYYKEYLKIQKNIKKDLPQVFQDTKNLEPFYNGVRRAVNGIGYPSNKISFTIETILSNLKKNRKTLVYSTWKEFGISIISDILDNMNIPYGIITGAIPKDLRNNYVKDYNANKVKVMLISSAGGEGLSLKETRSVIIMEPHWNNEKINQVIGRAIRYKSHNNLPPKERHVDIYMLLLVKPRKNVLMPDDFVQSVDEILYNKSLFKDRLTNNFYKKLNPLSIENNKLCWQ